MDDMDAFTFLRLATDFDGGVLSRLRSGPVTLGTLMEGPRPPFGSTLKEWQHSTRCLELVVNKLLEPGVRGRRRDMTRLDLCIRVREVLSHHRIRVTKSRDGQFARILVLVLDAVGEKAPEDTFHLVKQVVDGIQPSRRRCSRA